MSYRARVACASLCVVLLLSLSSLPAQRPANSSPFYQQLRGLLPGGEVIQVKQCELRRDAAVFTLRQGSVTFYGEVNGKVTGAVFEGTGTSAHYAAQRRRTPQSSNNKPHRGIRR